MEIEDCAISLRNLYKVFGPDPAEGMEMISRGDTKDEILESTGNTVGVQDASFDVEPQEIFIVMGLSGSGKSTLLRCVIRLIEPTDGQIYLDGDNVTDMDGGQLRQLRREKTGMVFQQFALFPHRKVIDNVAYGLEIQGVSRQERYRLSEEMLDTVGLSGWEDYYPSNLSGGMQQRVGLARALVHDPSIMLLDEPFSALDPLIRRDMQRELLDLQKRLNKTMLFITHDLDEALRLGDRIAIMNEGEIVQIGTAKQIVTEPADDYVASFVQDIDRAKILTARDVATAEVPMLSQQDSVSSAWQKLSQTDAFCVVVTDDQRRLLGMVYSHDIRANMDNGTVSLEPLPVHEIESVSSERSVEDLFPLLGANSHPLAVTDSDGRLAGVADASSLVNGLVKGEERQTVASQ